MGAGAAEEMGVGPASDEVGAYSRVNLHRTSVLSQCDTRQLLQPPLFSKRSVLRVTRRSSHGAVSGSFAGKFREFAEEELTEKGSTDVPGCEPFVKIQKCQGEHHNDPKTRVQVKAHPGM